MAKWKDTLKIGGVTFKKEGPYYCPFGTGWELLERMVQRERDSGLLVRVKKYPIKRSDQKRLGGNTHIVYILYRKERA